MWSRCTSRWTYLAISNKKVALAFWNVAKIKWNTKKLPFQKLRNVAKRHEPQKKNWFRRNEICPFLTKSQREKLGFFLKPFLRFWSAQPDSPHVVQSRNEFARLCIVEPTRSIALLIFCSQKSQKSILPNVVLWCPKTDHANTCGRTQQQKTRNRCCFPVASWPKTFYQNHAPPPKITYKTSKSIHYSSVIKFDYQFPHFSRHGVSSNKRLVGATYPQKVSSNSVELWYPPKESKWRMVGSAVCWNLDLCAGLIEAKFTMAINE